MKEQIVITDAISDDAASIRSAQAKTWLSVYPNEGMGISYADIEEKVRGMQSQEAIRGMQKYLQEPSSHTWIAKDGNVIVAFLGVLKQNSDNSVKALYVLPEYQGMGIGSELMKKGLKWLGSDKLIKLEVVTYNLKAISFYKQFGFIENGITSNESGKLPSGKVLPQIEMVLK